MIPNEILLCALGLLANLISVLSEMSAARKTFVSPLAYIRERPYKVVMAIIGAVIGYVVLMQINELSMLTAFGAGYISSDGADRAGRIANAKMR